MKDYMDPKNWKAEEWREAGIAAACFIPAVVFFYLIINILI